MQRRRSLLDSLGSSLTALCGAALGLNLLLVLGLLTVLAVNGLGHFWQKPLVSLTLDDGTRLLGEVHDREPTRDRRGMRIRLKVGNRDVDGIDFLWIDEERILERQNPPEALYLERQEWGGFYGYPIELRRGDRVIAIGADLIMPALEPLLRVKHDELDAIHDLEKNEIGRINLTMEELRLEQRGLGLRKLSVIERERLSTDIERRTKEANATYELLSTQLFRLRDAFRAETLTVEASGGQRKEIAVGDIVRVVQPNGLGIGGRAALYLSRTWEFVAGDPRESNTEGGIFPAIFGTVMMVFLMSFAVAPLGVLAALYLHEYARQGLGVRLVRVAVNNLASVPSIVFGVFGLGFFVYTIGGNIDRLFYPEALPAPTYGTGGILWASLTLALLTVPVVIVATEEGLAAVPRIARQGSHALGATKFETTWRVVLPAATPGVLTGMILAMARAAGEVAPLMIVGMVKLAPALPVDGYFPFVHLNRKFMHLGFHIYDVGFQSPNVEATKSIVFATALLLIAVVATMNVLAIVVRNRLRARYRTSAI